MNELINKICFMLLGPLSTISTEIIHYVVTFIPRQINSGHRYTNLFMMIENVLV